MKYLRFIIMMSIIVTTMFSLIECQPSQKTGKTTQEQYIELCGACHGRNLEYLKEKDKWMFEKNYESIFKVIKEGIKSVKMPAYKNDLSDQEIKNMTNFILKELS